MLTIADVAALSTALERMSRPHTSILDAAEGLSLASETARERGLHERAARYAELSQALYARTLAPFYGAGEERDR